MPWGPGTAEPEPWACWFCNSSFGSYEVAEEHERKCGASKGWTMEQGAGWVKAGGPEEGDEKMWWDGDERVAEYGELLQCMVMRASMDKVLPQSCTTRCIGDSLKVTRVHLLGGANSLAAPTCVFKLGGWKRASGTENAARFYRNRSEM